LENEAPLCSRAGTDEMIDWEGETEEDKEARKGELYAYFGIDTTSDAITIASAYCGDYDTSELSDWYKEDLEFLCENYNAEKKAQDDADYVRYRMIMTIIIIFLLFVGYCYLLGFKTIFHNLIYFVSLRWLLKSIYLGKIKVNQEIDDLKKTLTIKKDEEKKNEENEEESEEEQQIWEDEHEHFDYEA
jgi:hypothetical protein